MVNFRLSSSWVPKLRVKHVRSARLIRYSSANEVVCVGVMFSVVSVCLQMVPMWPLSMIPLVSHRSCGASNLNPSPVSLPSLYWEPPKHVQTCSTRTSPYRTPWDMVKLVQLRPHTLGTQAHYPPPHLPDIFKFVHYVAQTVGKWAVGIRLKCHLVRTITQPVRGQLFQA